MKNSKNMHISVKILFWNIKTKISKNEIMKHYFTLHITINFNKQLLVQFQVLDFIQKN